jgi:hypothetical protein
MIFIRKIFIAVFVLIFLPLLVFYFFSNQVKSEKTAPKLEYWLVLQRSSNHEHLYYGLPGDENRSKLIKTFKVKSGIPKQRPTPLPQLLGRNYWLITDKFEVKDNHEISPYFLKLDIPYSEKFPFGPVPYLECNGQCNWELPGSFGLHGVGGDMSRLSVDNPGSSGCVRHSDEDITFLYNLLNPKKSQTRYYIFDT